MTIAQMRAFLGLADSVSDSDVAIQYAAYLAGQVEMVPALSLALVKSHLRLEAGDTTEDDLLGILLTASQQSVANYIDKPIDGGNEDNPDLAVIRPAMLLLIGHWYANREAVGKDGGEMPMSIKWLLDSIKRWVC